MLEKIKSDQEREALLSLGAMYEKYDPVLMVPVIHFTVMKEVVRLLRAENEEMRERLNLVEAPK